MATISLAIERPIETLVETPRELPTQRLLEIAQSYVFEGQESLCPGDLYLASREILNRIAVAEEKGLTPRDVVQSILRPTFAIDGHCRCTSCRGQCLMCRKTGARNL